jgi:uncharacterized protein (TIGR02145 family)
LPKGLEGVERRKGKGESKFQIKLRMKKHILFLGLLLIVFGLRIDAQTFKNIHRHNQPVLRIPVDLINKVESIEIDNEKVLRIIPLIGEPIQVPFSEIDSVTHYTGTVDPTLLGAMRTTSVMGVVTGPTGAPEMNAIVRSPYGGEETRTDPNGVFFLNNILVYDKLGYITITKPGFHQGSRSFLPLETGSNRVNVQLLPMTQSGTFSAASGGTVISGLLQLTFPANGIIRSNGQPYAGNVKVYAVALNPTSTSMFDQMPGELLGGLNDSLRLLRSFGMANIELRDPSMNELQLATGVSATLTFNIPNALQAEAPETIDWWSFDETLGYWKHEGEAQKQNNKYIGLASHFSWWNCDVPQNFNDFQGSVNTSGGIPISNAQINLVSPTLGPGITYTNNEGSFSGRVPKNQSLTLNVKLYCNTNNTYISAYSETIISGVDVLSGLYTAELTNFYAITGTLLNCIQQPLESGYVRIGSQIYIIDNGAFTIQSCATGSFSIRGYNTINPDSIKVSELINVQVNSSGAIAGNIPTCSNIFGSVNDIEGNIYETVLIGNQWWTAENLRTSSYANGEPMLNVTDTTAWLQLNSGAWCNYSNNVANDTVYGKLYNWYSTVDPRGLCPTGWHVPTDDEWTILTNELGGLDIASGKMKSLSLWNAPNTGATNESGFSALPGGSRPGNGLFYFIVLYGHWWCSSESSPTIAWGYSASHDNGFAIRFGSFKQDGASVRCLKD